MKYKISPLQEIALFLGVMSVGAIGFNFSSQVVLHLAVTLGFALILYWLFSLVSNKHKNIWDTVTTALIIFLVLHYGTGYGDALYAAAATLLAMVVKFFVEYKSSPIVNPAAAAILLMAALAALVPSWPSPIVSWWGASFRGPVSLALIILWVVFGLAKWRKYPTVLAFLFTHLLLMIFRGESGSFIQYTFTDSTIYFLAAVMLVEPKTSPAFPRRQAFYGIIAGIVYNVLVKYNAPYFGLFSIVAANLANVLLLPRPKSTKKTKPVTLTSGEEE